MKALLKSVRKNTALYCFILPAMVYIVVFHYIPLYGIQIAFRDFSAGKGIWNSSWVGMKHFLRFIDSYLFLDLIKNTLSLSVYHLIVGFPMPIILSLLIHYSSMKKMRKIAQTVTYAPHFISTVVMVGMLLLFFSKDGFINQLIVLTGGTPRLFLSKSELFRHLYVWSGIWQSTGWSSVIYIATLAGVNQELYEAATVDGANKLQRIRHVDLPHLLPTAVILLILNMGNLMSIGFEKVFLMQNDINIGVSEIISTYVYKVGLLGAQYSYSTAIGLFNNVINFTILVIVNRLARGATELSLW